MISFRYLVVTIVSIFLALGLGILAGTTVIDQSLVRNLRDQTAAAEQTAARQGRQLDDLKTLLRGLVPFSVQGKLAHRKVVLVTDANADGGAVGEAITYIKLAGGDLVAQLRVTDAFDPTNTDRSGLRQILTNAGLPPPGDPSIAAARDLADRVADGPPPTDVHGNPVGPDLLADLLTKGYVSFPSTATPKPQDIGGPGQVVVVVAGGHRDPAVPFGSFLLPFVEELVRQSMPVGVGEPRSTRHSFVGVVRTDQAVDGADTLATVDDLSSSDPRGGLALVLALRDLLRTEPIGGNYGVKDGADGVLPSPP